MANPVEIAYPAVAQQPAGTALTNRRDARNHGVGARVHSGVAKSLNV